MNRCTNSFCLGRKISYLKHMLYIMQKNRTSQRGRDKKKLFFMSDPLISSISMRGACPSLRLQERFPGKVWP